jgi:polysaccharide biosynthesis protein PslG
MITAASGLVLPAHAGTAPRFGINQDFVWTAPANIPELIQGMKDARVQAVRIEIRWRDVQPVPSQWDFTRVDAVVAALHDAKIEILPVLMSVPAWASGVNPAEVKGFYDAYLPERLDDWQEFVRRVALRYRKEIHFWEIWNEENGQDFYKPIPNAPQYVALLKAAHDTIKRIDRKATIVLGGLQMNGIIPNPWLTVKTTNFLQQIYDAGGGRCFDVANIHPYVLATKQEGPAYCARLVRDTVQVMKKNGDGRKPLWITETGLPTDATTTEQMQADHLTGIYRELGKIPQVKAIYWFLLQDLNQAVSGGEDTMGIIASNGRRKPSFDALKQAIAAKPGL